MTAADKADIAAMEALALRMWRRLSPAMHDALRYSEYTRGGGGLVHPPCCSRVTARALLRRKLVAPTGGVLTPLGLLVRYVGTRSERKP